VSLVSAIAKNAHPWPEIMLASVLFGTLVRIAWRKGLCAAWLTRNFDRYTTLLFVAELIFRSDFRGLNAFAALCGIIGWNFPKDEDPPERRRRRKQERKEEHLPPNWSGVPEGTT